MVASALSVAVSFIFTPIIARIYGPAEYGQFAVLNSFATIWAAICLFSLPNALAVTGSRSDHQRLVPVLVKLSFLAAALAALVSAVAVSTGLGASNLMQPWAIWAVPPLVLAIAFSRIATSFAIAMGRFRGQVRARYAYSLATRPISAGLGYVIAPKAWIMVLSEAVGMLGSALATVADFPQRLRQLCRVTLVAKARILPEIKGNLIFTGFDYPTQLLVIAMTFVPIVTVSAKFGPSTTGALSISLSLLSIPIQMIALAVAPALLHWIRLWSEKRDRNAARKVCRSAAAITFVSIGGYGLLWAIAGWLVPLLLGAKWQAATGIVVSLCLAFAIQFVVTPFESIYWFSGHIRAKLAIYLAGVCLIPAAILGPMSANSSEALAKFTEILTVQRIAELFLLVIAFAKVRKDSLAKA